jgi:hypothetical protein
MTFPATLYEHVTNIMNDRLKRAEDAVTEGKLDSEAAERLRVSERLTGVEEAVKAIARQLDNREAK